MTRANSKVPLGKTQSSRGSRQLRFDVLENRRVLAGIDVFVFDDLDSTRSFDSVKDGSLTDRAVYVDLNNDGKLGSSEPWAVTDRSGVARFPNLEPGVYSVRLLGSNNSVVQTFPTGPADQGTWTDNLNITKLLRVQSNGLVWGVTGNALSLVDVAGNKTFRSMRFGSSTVIDAAFETSSNDSELTGFVLARNQDHSQVLWQISTAGNGTIRATNVDVTEVSQLVSVGGHVLLVGGSNLKEISVLETDNDTKEVVRKGIGVGGLHSDSVVNSTGSNSFLVFDGEANSNRLSLYKLSNGIGEIVGTRSFPSYVISWDISSDGSNIAVSTIDDFMILSPEPGLPTKAILEDAVGPIVFDPIRDLLITGTASNQFQLTVWNTPHWTKSIAIPVANPGIISGAGYKLLLDAAGTQLVATQNGLIYQQRVSTPVASIATLVGNEITKLQIGVRTSGVNRKPELKRLDALAVDEDTQLRIDSARIQSKASDLDGDSLIYLVRTNPTIGRINWNEDGSGAYMPSINANGQDSITIQAYDGRDWSMPQILPIVINPVNDLASGIATSVDSVAENSSFHSILATLQAIDPDSDADYEFRVNDSRFSIVEGILQLVRGSINFEEEPFIVLAVIGIDRLHPQDSISRSITLSVRDVNEAPTGILSPSKVTIPELTDNVELSRVSAIDQDTNERYSWTVSDHRFEIVNGTLKLARGSFLDFEGEPTIALTLRGTDSSGQFSIEKTITVAVTDQDDEPTGLALNISASILENQTGKSLGDVSVLDPDQGEVYSYGVNDSRFEVVRGALKLKAGASVGYVDPGYLDLIVTATSLRTGARISGDLRLNIVKDPTPYHNDENPYDVDGDGVLTPLDPLILINHINNKGIGPIEKPGEGEGTIPDLDVDGDGEVTPIDILILINKLNEQNDEGFDSGLPEAEGEGLLVKTDSKLGPAVQPVKQSSSLQIVPDLYDASLASYLSELTNEVGPRKLRRK